jgi:hypothetical protein
MKGNKTMKGNKVDKLRNGIVGFDIENEDSMTEIDKEIIRLWFKEAKRVFADFYPLLFDAILLSMKQAVGAIYKAKFIQDARADFKEMSIDEARNFLMLTHDTQLIFVRQERTSKLSMTVTETINDIFMEINYFNTEISEKLFDLTFEEVFSKSSIHLRKAIKRLEDWLYEFEIHDDMPYNHILSQMNFDYSAMEKSVSAHDSSMNESELNDYSKQYHTLKYTHFFVEFRDFATKLFKAILLEIEDEAIVIKSTREIVETIREEQAMVMAANLAKRKDIDSLFDDVDENPQSSLN